MATQYEKETYAGRCIEDSRSMGGGYMGSGGLELHVKMLNDPASWISRYTIERWHETFLEDKRVHLHNIELLDELRFIRNRTRVLEHLSKAAEFIDNEIKLLEKKL